MVEYDENSYAAELKKKPICRFCLSQEDTLTNIYSTSNTNSQVALSMQIMACVSIEVNLFSSCANTCVFAWENDGFCFDIHSLPFVHPCVRSVPMRSRKKKINSLLQKTLICMAFFPSGKWTPRKQKIIAELMFMPNQPHWVYVLGEWNMFNLSSTSSFIRSMHRSIAFGICVFISV